MVIVLGFHTTRRIQRFVLARLPLSQDGGVDAGYAAVGWFPKMPQVAYFDLDNVQNAS